MARLIGEALVRVRPDTKGLGDQVKRESSAGLSKALKATGVLAGSSLAVAMVATIKDSISSASDLNETQSKVQQIFGKSSAAVQKFASDSAKSLGQSKQSALDAASTFGIFGKAAGLSGQNLVQFSTKLTGLATDLASFNNTSPEQAIEAIGAALRGESEPIRSYGVLLNDAAIQAEGMRLGLVKATKNVTQIQAAQITAENAQRRYNQAVKDHGKDSQEARAAQAALLRAQNSLTNATQGSIPPLTNQQRVLATQSLIFKQTSAAQGDFARTSGGLANQQRILSAQWENAKASLGARLLPAILQAVNGFNSLTKFVQENRKWVIPLTAAIGGFIATVYIANAATKAWAQIQAASTVITKVATVATKAFGVAIRFATGPIGIIITVIGLLVAAIVYLYQHNETARRIIDAVWKAIRVAIKAVVDWFVNTAWPALRASWNAIVAAAKFLGNAIAAYFRFWFNVGKTVVSGAIALFNNLKTWFTVTLPNAARTFSTAIGNMWKSIQELAKKPVRFVIETIVNQGIIGTFNKISGVFSGPHINPLALPKGFGDGPGKGTGDGFGDAMSFLAKPAQWVSSKIGLGRIAAQFGNNPFVQVLTGMGGKLASGLVGKLTSLISTGSEILGSITQGVKSTLLQSGIKGVLGSLRARFGNVPLISGFRPFARTLSGKVSYHALGRAIDVPAVLPWAMFLSATFGSQLKELISPWNWLNILNGRPHAYTGDIYRQHSGPNAHIHAAMDNRRGGYLLPGLNVIPNGTGRAEAIYGTADLADLAGLLAAILMAIRNLGGDVAAAMEFNSRRALRTGRGRAAVSVGGV